VCVVYRMYSEDTEAQCVLYGEDSEAWCVCVVLCCVQNAW